MKEIPKRFLQEFHTDEESEKASAMGGNLGNITN